MIRINNNAPIIVILVLLIGLFIQKMGILGITMVAAIVCVVALNWFGIIHTQQLINYGEKISDFLLSNESPLELKSKLDKFSDSINKETTTVNKVDPIDVPSDVIYKDMGVLAKYEKLQEELNKFIDVIEDKTSLAPLDKDMMKREFGTKIGYLMYNAYLTMNDPYYKGKNYRSCLDSQKELLNCIHSFIYLDMGENSYHDDEMNRLLDKTIKLNNELNEFMVNNNDELKDILNEPVSMDINEFGSTEDNRFKKINISGNLYF